MAEFLSAYGQLAAFLCAIFENDVTFILIGVLAHLQMIDPLRALLAGLAGALVHDSLWFWLGHARSETIKRHRVYRRVGPAVERLAARFGPAELFLSRFVYGTRTASIVFWGVQRLALTTFLLIEIVALALWGSALAAAGYGFSHAAAAIIGHVRNVEGWMLGAFIMAVALFLAARIATRHSLRKRLPPRP